MQNIGGHADDRKPWQTPLRWPDANLSTNRILRFPDATRERIVDDRDGQCAFVILVSKGAAGQYLHAGCSEIIGAYHFLICKPVLFVWRSRWRSFHIEL